MKYVLIVLLMFLVGCNPVPKSVHDMVVVRPDGTEMKIKWNDGQGSSYSFYDKVKVISQSGDTAIEWRIITE